MTLNTFAVWKLRIWNGLSLLAISTCSGNRGQHFNTLGNGCQWWEDKTTHCHRISQWGGWDADSHPWTYEECLWWCNNEYEHYLMLGPSWWSHRRSNLTHWCRPHTFVESITFVVIPIHKAVRFTTSSIQSQFLLTTESRSSLTSFWDHWTLKC